MSDSSPPPYFQPLVVGALYTGIPRSLAADVMACSALGGQALTVCTMHVVASHGSVTDVLPVPSDTVDAQLDHLRATTTPTGVKVGIVGSRKTIDVVFSHLREGDLAPVLLDVTLSGPSGEDIIDQRGVEALMDHLPLPDLVTLRRRDAELLAGMEIASMDDAQVAVQRLHKRGARRVLLRCGNVPVRFFEAPQDDADPAAFAMDLYYDGDEFGLFEAPHLNVEHLHGASSVLTLALLKELVQGTPIIEAMQGAKGYVSETLRYSLQEGRRGHLHVHWPHAATSAGD